MFMLSEHGVDALAALTDNILVLVPNSIYGGWLPLCNVIMKATFVSFALRVHLYETPHVTIKVK